MSAYCGSTPIAVARVSVVAAEGALIRQLLALGESAATDGDAGALHGLHVLAVEPHEGVAAHVAARSSWRG